MMMARRRTWLTVAILVLLGAGLAYAVFSYITHTSPARVGEPVPAVELMPLQGEAPVSLADFRGQPVLVNFFATWCEPCIEEAPELSAFAERYGEQVKLVMVDRAEPKVLVEEFVEQHGLQKATVLLDPKNRASRALGVISQPETWLIDEEGVLRFHQVGMLTVEGMVALVNGLTNTQLDTGE